MATNEIILEELSAIKRYCLLGAKNVLDLNDAIELTSLSKSHLYHLTSSGKIPHYKPYGKQIYFDRGELEAWLKQNRVATTKEVEQEAINYVVGRDINGKH